MSRNYQEEYDKIYKLDIDFDNSRKSISEPHIDFYRMFSENVNEFVSHLRDTKTVRSIAVETGDLRPKVVPDFKDNRFRFLIGANRKSSQTLRLQYEMFNVFGSFSRVTIALQSDALLRYLPIFPINSLNGFWKNSYKFVYSLPLPIDENKLQAFFKRIDKELNSYQKIGVCYDRFLENIDFGIFRIKNLRDPQDVRTKLKIKVKHGYLFRGSIPEGKKSYYKFQLAPFSTVNTQFHFKMFNKVYQYLDFIPFRLNLELENQFSVSTEKTGEYKNRLGYPNEEERLVASVQLFFNHFFNLKLNFYDVVGLRNLDISVFAFYAYMSRFLEPAKHEYGWGVEKYFSDFEVRLQCAYLARKGVFQWRMTQD